jgi:hypothetical protein
VEAPSGPAACGIDSPSVQAAQHIEVGGIDEVTFDKQYVKGKDVSLVERVRLNAFLFTTAGAAVATSHQSTRIHPCLGPFFLHTNSLEPAPTRLCTNASPG